MKMCRSGPPLALLTAVAGEQHADLKNDLGNNYASGAQYLLRLIEYRKEWHRGATNKPGGWIRLQCDRFLSKARCVCVRTVPVAYHNWRRPLPRPIVIPRIMTLETLEDVRALYIGICRPNTVASRLGSASQPSHRRLRVANCRR